MKKKTAEVQAQAAAENEVVTTPDPVQTEEPEKKRAEPDPVPDPEPVCYIGPTINGVVIHGVMYRGGIPDSVKKAAEQIPAIKNLLIPISRLAQAQREIDDPKSAISIMYKRAAAAARKRG